MKKYICRLREKIKRKNSSNNGDQEYPYVLNVEDIQNAETVIYQSAPKKIFQWWNKHPYQNETCWRIQPKSSSKITNLDPFVDANEVLCVGGRIKKSNLSTEYIHPILLSGKGTVTNLLVKWYHHSVGHVGRGYTLNRIRSFGYWIVDCEREFSGSVFHC